MHGASYHIRVFCQEKNGKKISGIACSLLLAWTLGFAELGLIVLGLKLFDPSVDGHGPLFIDGDAVMDGIMKDMNIAFWNGVRRQAVLGSDDFVDWIYERFLSKKKEDRLPYTERCQQDRR